MERWDDGDSWSTNNDEYIDSGGTGGLPKDPGLLIIDEHDAFSLKLLLGMAVIVLIIATALLCKCISWWKNRSTYRPQIDQAIQRAEAYEQTGTKKKE
jgi:hypothetical protein